MLKKTHVFGLVAAALAITPSAAFADQVAGSNTNLNQGSVSTGISNVTGQSASSTTVQDQYKNGFCNPGNQVAGSNTAAGQGSLTNGIGNVTGQAGSAVTTQVQNSGSCYFPFH